MELVIVPGVARLAPRLEFLGNEGELAPKGPRGGASPLYPEMEDGDHGTPPPIFYSAACGGNFFENFTYNEIRYNPPKMPKRQIGDVDYRC